MAAKRYLIVNADDSGRSSGVNRGILEAHAHGIVTSTSLMVRWPAAVEMAASAPAYPGLSLGLHFELGEWVFRDGEWEAAYEVVSLDDAHAIAAELTRQIETFRHLTGRSPTHLDSHQHVHRKEPIRSILLEKAQELDIPVRLCREDIQYCGKFYGQTDEGETFPGAIRVESLIRILEELPDGVTELACHPAEGTDFDSTYSTERAIELQTLCDARVRRAIERADIILASFASLASIQGVKA